MQLQSLIQKWSFPEVVNGNAARVVGGAVALGAVGIIATGAYALLPVMAFGFFLRVLSGPKLSPLALLATRVVVPLFGVPVVPVAGAPKRFAQVVGLVFTALASGFALGLHQPRVADGLLGVLAICAGLEASVDFCLGCKVYAFLIIRGWVPPPRPVEAALDAHP